MSYAIDDLKAIEVLERHCGWLAIPHGLASKGAYRLGARLMFRQGGSSIPDDDAAMLLKILGDWPRFLSRTQWRPKLYMAIGESPELREFSPPAPLGSLYTAGLSKSASGAAQVDQVVELWRAAFPDAGVRQPYSAPVQATEHDNLPSARAADALNVAYGGLHALGLASSLEDRSELVTHAASRPANFFIDASARPFQRSATSMDQALRDFSSMLNGPGDRYLPKPKTIEPYSVNVFNRWQAAVLGAGTAWKSASVNVDIRPYSEAPGLHSAVKSIVYTLPDTNSTRRHLVAAMKSAGTSAKAAAPRHTLRLASAMREISHHGWLLRQLGLVIEFELKESDWKPVFHNVPDYVPGAAVIMDQASGHPLGNANGPGFPQRSGVVLLSDERFELMQLDVQSAGRKLVQAAMTQTSKRDSAASPDERSVETAAQRTAALALVDRNTLARTPRTNSDRPSLNGLALLYGNDITLGIRPDIQTLQVNENAKPVQSSWKSLTGWTIRSAHLQAGNFPGSTNQWKDVTSYFEGIDAGEGLLGEASRLVSDGQAIGAISYDDIFTWDGWSLAVAHPDPGTEDKLLSFSRLTVGSLVVTLQARGDLPALRVGHGYLAGVRAVYIDGIGPSLAEAANAYGCNDNRPVVGLPGTGGHAFFPCMRYEPIAPPDIHLGECVDYAAFPQTSTKKAVLSSSAVRSNVRKFEVRYLVPPAISLEQAIALGMYDSKARRAQPPRSAFSGVCLTPSGRLPNVASPVVPRDAAPARESTIGDATDTIYHRTNLARDPTVPYLPDPWAKRLIIAAYRSSDNELLAWEFHDYYRAAGLAQWPDCEPLRLEIRRAQDVHLSLPRTHGSAQGRVEFRKEGSTLQLIVPIGEDLRIRAWHEVDEKVLEKSGIVDQMADYLRTVDALDCCLYLGIDSLDDKQKTREQVIHCLSNWRRMRHNRIRSQVSRELASGLTNVTCFGMINPDEVMTVLHAVDRPPAPRFLWSGLASDEVSSNVAETPLRLLPAARLRSFEQTVRFVREPGRTDALLAGDLEIDRPTCRRVDLSFSWSDPVDDLVKTGPELHSKNAILHVDPIPPILSRELSPGRQSPNARATPDLAEDDNLILLSGVRTRLKRTTNEDLGSKQLSVAFGDTRARIVDVTAVAHSRFADEYRKGASNFSSDPGQLRQLICPSSASPKVPSIDYVMPQYWWLELKGNHQAHERVGGCFRIWLNRPWFSSGVDERLAVVCWPPTTFDKSFVKKQVYRAFVELCGINVDPPPFVEPFVTRWGEDPLWRMNVHACVGSIPPEAFRRHVCDRPDIASLSKSENCFPVLDLRECEAMKPHLTSFEEADAKVALVLYEPAYDKQSGRYYVDVQVDEQYAYYPFVRLALARYQQHALPGFELSEINSHEFVQLPPKRRTEVEVLGRRGDEVDVAVRMTGSSPAAPKNSTEWNTRVIARLEYLPIKTWEKLSASVPARLGPHGVAWVPDYKSTKHLQLNKTMWELTKATFTLEMDRMYSIVVEECELGFQDAVRDEVQSDGTVDTRVRPSARRVFADRLLLPVQS